jgi:hypothetical protein
MRIKTVILNKDCDGFKFELIALKEKDFKEIDKLLTDQQDIHLNGREIKYKDVKGWGTIPDKYPRKLHSKQVIPYIYVPDIEKENDRTNEKTKAYWCFANSHFDYDKTLIPHTDIDSSWNCIKEILIAFTHCIILKIKLDKDEKDKVVQKDI